MKIKFANTNLFKNYKLHSTIYDNLYVTDIPINQFDNKAAEYYITADNLNEIRRMPYKADSTLILNPYQNEIPCGVDENNLPQVPENFNLCSLNPSLITYENNLLTITASLKKESEISINIYDLTARLCFEKQYPLQKAGISSIQIPTGNFLNGNYYVIVNFNGINNYLRFIVAR